MRFLARHRQITSLEPMRASAEARAEQVKSLEHVKCNLQHSYGSCCQLVERKTSGATVGKMLRDIDNEEHPC